MLNTIAEHSQGDIYHDDDSSGVSSENYSDGGSLSLESADLPPPPPGMSIMPPGMPASPPRYDRFVNGEEEKREITADDFDGEESSNRLAAGAAAAGAGAGIIGGAFGAKALLDSQDGGNQEYIDPDNHQMSSLHDSFLMENSDDPSQAEAIAAAGGKAAGGVVMSEIGKKAMKLLEKTDDDHNDIADHLRNAEKADQIVGNFSSAQQATQTAQALKAAQAAQAAKAAQ
jgi:hypothetical protein